MYAAVKAAAIYMAFSVNADWAQVMASSWGADDFAMLNMCLTFWFVGRSIEKYKDSK
jgi:hypothetical protein